MTKLKDLVRLLNGEVDTIDNFSKQGRVTWEVTPNWNGVRCAYFATFDKTETGNNGSIEISKYAYLGRIAKATE